MEIIEQVHALVTTERLAVLATQGEQGPYTSLVSVAASPDLQRLIFPTLRASTKYGNLVRHAEVALMLDTRSNTERDLTGAVTLTALGRAIEVGGQERSALQGIFLAKHPELGSFVCDPDCALIAVQVRQYVLVTRFDHKTVLDVSQVSKHTPG